MTINGRKCAMRFDSCSVIVVDGSSFVLVDNEVLPKIESNHVFFVRKRVYQECLNIWCAFLPFLKAALIEYKCGEMPYWEENIHDILANKILEKVFNIGISSDSYEIGNALSILEHETCTDSKNLEAISKPVNIVIKDLMQFRKHLIRVLMQYANGMYEQLRDYY